MLYKEKFSRNNPVLSKAQQNKISSTIFSVVGLGGIGGFVIENLVRMGAQNFILFDHDRFELTNFNRQILATDETLDCRKTEAAKKRMKAVNSKVKIEKYSEFDAEKIIEAEMAIDCTDNIATKLSIANACRSAGIPCVFSSSEGSRGIVSLFTKYRFEKAFQVDDKKLATRSCASIICPAASIAGSLAAIQAVNYLIGKPVVCAPKAMFFDVFDKRIFWIGGLG